MFKDFPKYHYYLLTQILKSEQFPFMSTHHVGEGVLKMHTGLEQGILTYDSNRCSKYGCFIMNDDSPWDLHLINISTPQIPE